MADAAHAILLRNAREFSGNQCMDDIVLFETGVTDFRGYRVTPGDDALMPDLFVPKTMPQPEGILV